MIEVDTVDSAVVREANPELLVALAQAMADKPSPEPPVTPPADLPGGPRVEPKSNATAMERMRELFGADYDFGKATRFALQKAVVETVAGINDTEKRLVCPKQAVIVAAVAELMRRFKMTYQAIADLIAEGALAEGKPSAVRNHPDSGLPAEVVKHGKPPERQFATRYVRLAQWTNARMTGSWKKADTYPAQYVTIMGVDYMTPVDALMGGHSMNRVDMAWNWKIRRTPRQDMSSHPTEGQVTAEYAASLIENIKLPIRVPDDKTVDAEGRTIAEKRSSVSVVGHPLATAGTVIGLLAASAKLGMRLTLDQCNTIIELAEQLAPESTPAEVEPA